MPSQHAPGRKSLEALSHDAIMAHVLDPENSPLTPTQARQYARVVQAARLLDDNPDTAHVVRLMQEKYDIGATQLRKDVALARELFKTEHTFDWDFWRAWEIKDQIELIQKCKAADDYKNWNAAKKHLHEIIGERPEAGEDPKRMEKNMFLIQVNNGSAAQPVNIPLDLFRQLSADDRKTLLDSLTPTIGDAEAQEIFDS